MPELSRFFGIVMKMYFQSCEHNPPHVHAVYGSDSAEFEISTGKMLDGYLPPRAKAMVTEWIELNRESLLKIWETQEFSALPPLE